MDHLIVVRGGGDIASGTIHRLSKCGFPVLVLETSTPSAIRRKVSFSEAVYDDLCMVEDVSCQLVTDFDEAQEIMRRGNVALMIDSQATITKAIHPWILIDAILAKKNIGTRKDMAFLTVGLGPGFVAGTDVDYVIETMRGHNLGRIIEHGSALADTKTPGIIEGFGQERVIYSRAEGIINIQKDIGSLVSKGDIIAYIERKTQRSEIFAPINGVLRGMIRNGFYVKEGVKVADIDPRESEAINCYTISDKARCIAGSVLEVIVRQMKGTNLWNFAE